MNSALKPTRKKITAYQVFGWVPLLITVVGATTVVAFSVIRDL